MAYIINRHGILHSIPDDMRIPAGARKATAKEIEEWQKEDAANKAVLLAQKRKSAQDRAQVVIMAAPAPVMGVMGGNDGSEGSKDEPNAKPAK